MEPNASNPIAEAIEWVCDQIKDSSFLLSVWLFVGAVMYAAYLVVLAVMWLVKN